jgi:outer membrane lipopolysaccharide assembly protein LptE/RlpB
VGVTLLCGCGYRFVGGEGFPFGIQTVFVQVLKNRTGETGIENILTNDLIYEFTRSGRVRVVGPAQADAVLSGNVRSAAVTTASRRSEIEASERRVTVSVNLVLKSSEGEVLWEVSGISASETFPVRSDELGTDISKRLAISVLSKRLAESVYRIITDLE